MTVYYVILIKVCNFFQSPAVPLLVDPGEAAVAEVSSVSEEEEEDEETLNSVFLKPLNGKHRGVDQDFTTLIDQ